MFYVLLTIGLAAGVYAFVTHDRDRRCVAACVAGAVAFVALWCPGRW
ncbi:hypothetical protein ACFRDV_22165 [Streptomyces fagopyri]